MCTIVSLYNEMFKQSKHTQVDFNVGHESDGKSSVV